MKAPNFTELAAGMSGKSLDGWNTAYYIISNPLSIVTSVRERDGSTKWNDSAEIEDVHDI